MLFWIIDILAGLAIIFGFTMAGHFILGIISALVVCYMAYVADDIVSYIDNTKIFIVLSILGSAVMIGVAILGILIDHTIIAGIIGIVFNGGLRIFISTKEKAVSDEEKWVKVKRQQEEREQEWHRVKETERLAEEEKKTTVRSPGSCAVQRGYRILEGHYQRHESYRGGKQSA